MHSRVHSAARNRHGHSFFGERFERGGDRPGDSRGPRLGALVSRFVTIIHLWSAFFALCGVARAQIAPADAVLFIDGRHTNGLRLVNGAKWVSYSNGSRLEFTTSLQYAEMPLAQSL